ncbi:asparaginase domain-containing protein [Maritimibacter sp. UBA3975]|uniref:asparaginase domain-containing protein n=1 Tax=Maritimibacter sp. UBA3975 TaxID=1946833 RepID=UPI000C08ECE7|nr:asparaginase domain-containing protein [Maritimibacter sp. UBA3975]MAM62645.1 aminopeptidase [Maritimibacter sp.]|tara:strand:- start:25983 stop:26837 length:855 start_codon:yes stop_codon:yes gene_type:complete
MEIVLIHTGGTIGMVPSPDGLVPETGRVERAVATLMPTGAQLTTHVFDPLLDSADVGPADWNRMLDLIDAHPKASILVTHGTDTMSFTGAALAQALAGRDVRVMLCGAMAPLGAGEGARANLTLAVATLLAPGWTGVKCAFAQRIMEAGGLIKHDTRGDDAFRAVAQDPADPPARTRFDPDRRLAMLALTPGLPAKALRGALAALDGAVLRVFGSGTIMHDPAIHAALADAIASGTRIRAVSQCEAGGLAPGHYAAGQPLWSAGVENGGRETPEAALIRLWLNP